MYVQNLSSATFRNIDNNTDILNKIDNIFEEGLILINSKSYVVEICIYNDTKYIRSVIPYEEHEFEKIFDFGCKCSDFVKGKVVQIVNQIPSI